MKSQAQESLSALSELQAERSNTPQDALGLSTLLDTLKKQLDALKAIDQNKLSTSNKKALQEAVQAMNDLVQQSSQVAGQYGKVLAYYPENDLYGIGVSKETTLGRSGEAVNNLKKLTIQNGESADALQNTVTCLEDLQKFYQQNSCVVQYQALRKAAIKDISSQFNDQKTAQVKEYLAKLVR